LTIDRSKQVLRCRFLVIAAAIVSAHCADSGALPDGVMSRDSSGISIMDIPGPILDSLPVWFLENPPLEIGVTDGPPEYTFFRAATPLLMTDGTITVANNRSEIRFYAPDGRHLQTVGTSGEGPGEYLSLRALYLLSDDSILALDMESGRATVLDRTGRYARSIVISAQAQFPLGFAWLPDGTAWYLDASPHRLFAKTYGRPPGLLQDTTLLLRTRPEGAPGDTADRLPGAWLRTIPGSISPLPFAGEPFFAAGGGSLVAGHGDIFAIRWYSPRGKLLRIVRSDLAPAPVTAAAIERHEAERRLSAERRGVGTRTQFVTAYPQHFPFIAGVVIDHEGNVWLRRWTPPNVVTATWLVFSPNGIPVARIDLPVAFRVSDIKEKQVLGVFTDQDGVEFIRLYRLKRDLRARGR
jgi:hypothetical protein